VPQGEGNHRGVGGSGVRNERKNKGEKKPGREERSKPDKSVGKEWALRADKANHKKKKERKGHGEKNHAYMTKPERQEFFKGQNPGGWPNVTGYAHAKKGMTRKDGNQPKVGKGGQRSFSRMGGGEKQCRAWTQEKNKSQNNASGCSD